jgi:hypothetical protein
MSEATPSRWDDYLDVFASPSRLFERRSDGKFGHAMLVFIIAAVVLYFATRTAMQPIMDAEFERGMAANPNLTPEQMEAGRKFAGIAGGIFVVVGTPILMLLLGGVIWIAAKVVGKSLDYAQSATIATFAMFPRLVDSVVSAVQALLMDESSLNSRYKVSLGIGRFLNPDNGVLLALVGRLDVFTIWVTVLIAIGIKVMTKATAGQAVAAAALVWLVGSLPMLLQALRAG